MPADVRSFDAIRGLRDELDRFSKRSRDGLDEIAGQVRRAMDWIEHDRPAYWRRRSQRAYDDVAQAKAALQRCLMYPTDGEAPSCSEEKAALKTAQAHLALCEEKQRRAREWARDLRHELHEYEGRTAALKSAVEIDAPRAVALLDRTLEALQRYVAGSPQAARADRDASTSPTDEPHDGEAPA